ncbi:MAG: 3-hydroxyisobutyrate dehydrogenase [Alphaproteobacteria bacterium]
MARIGFAGLGNMGGPMAANLVKAGHQVTGYDPVEAARDIAAGQGIEVVNDLAAIAEGADALITMLPAGPQARDVWSGTLIEAAPGGALLIDCSTIDVQTARDLAQEADQRRGLTLLDAPVSGGVAGATGGMLTFMVGGSQAGFAAAQPLLGAMGRNIFHAGASGAGQAAKICNNMMLGIQMISVCEGFALAEKLGLAPEKLFEISSTASGQCWSLTAYCPEPGLVETAPSNRDWQPGFAALMMLKDLKLAQEAAATSGAETPLGLQAAELYQAFCDNGGSEFDFSGIINWLKDRSDEK